MATQINNLPGTKPTHLLYVVTGKGTSASWREIGAAWPNRDGMGYSLNCAAMPLQGRIVMRAITEKPTRNAGQQCPRTSNAGACPCVATPPAQGCDECVAGARRIANKPLFIPPVVVQILTILGRIRMLNHKHPYEEGAFDPASGRAGYQRA